MQDSLHARQSKTVLNSGFHVVDSGFQVLSSGSFDVLRRIGALSCHKLLVHKTEDKINLEGNSSYRVASFDQRRGNKTNKL